MYRHLFPLAPREIWDNPLGQNLCAWRLLAPLRLPGQIFMATPYALRFVVWIVPGF